MIVHYWRKGSFVDEIVETLRQDGTTTDMVEVYSSLIDQGFITDFFPDFSQGVPISALLYELPSGSRNEPPGKKTKTEQSDGGSKERAG